MSGGGVVVLPCVSRGSSPRRASRSASRPAVESTGTNPSRHTRRQLSIVAPPHLSDSVAACGFASWSPRCVSPVGCVSTPHLHPTHSLYVCTLLLSITKRTIFL